MLGILISIRLRVAIILQLIGLMTLGLLAGCAVTDEGATDFRFVGAEGSQNSSDWKKNFLPKEASQAIKPGEPISVVLKHAFIANFSEFFHNPFVEESGANGEIAIVANVFEDDGTKTVDYGPGGLSNARVVYFSDDVWKEQQLNFHDVPIYGPIRYHGGPLVLDMHVVELDQPGPQLKQLLSNLAEIGSVAYPPASPIASPLAQLAGTLITDDQDDRAYRHTLTQRPVGGADGVRYSVIDAGHLVFVRQQERRKDIEWFKIGFNQHLSMLVNIDPNDKASSAECLTASSLPDGCVYRDNTYLVVEINTASSSLKQDRQQALFSTLRSSSDDSRAAIFRGDVPADALTQIGLKLAETDNADFAGDALGKLEGNNTNALERLTAAERFASIWFNDTKKFSPFDEASLTKRIGDLMAACFADPAAFASKMAALRTRDMSYKEAFMTDVLCPQPADKAARKLQ